MDDKISIILPIFNVGPHLRGGIDSLINQTIGHENLEIIMVDDCSKDDSGEIIDEYAAKYDCCKAIHFEENSGSATAPRNRGIEEATGNYLMFLDPDDRFVEDACETLYAAIVEHDADVAFARFRRIFPDKVQKSYSPFIDDLETNYPGEEFQEANPLNISDALWKSVFKRILYGRDNPSNYNRDRPIDEIVIEDIQEEIDILNIPPAVWSKIYRADFIKNNDIRFPDFRCGEDLAFSFEVFLKAKGIVFLNNYMCCNYYIRDSGEDKSITHDVDARFLKELMDSYTYCRKLTVNYPKEVQVTIDPYLMYWINAWRGASLTKEENIELLKSINKLREIHKSSLKSILLLSTMSTLVESAIHTKKSN
ncbi:MAG: glycosyltransferase family 2 protein [Methanobrevibacter sp.]|uniref:glycosyltransferase n=1 Tax=Methanobrevibacter sp. TaxID=66852 RepID=UPI0026DF2027|nr:glycosyltransferase family 2 protein [Methanobrevibacter sp.]MDO5848454.1 glycosyltransferase family 2 protein [Methanobrevibacter sp.]